MATYKIDPSHSEIQFKVKHMMITNVNGQFTQFDGSLTADAADFSDAQINFEASVDSITTHNEQRDAHLKSADFFNAAEFPKLTFVSSSFKKNTDDTYKLSGLLTIRGISKPVVLDVEYGGTMTDPWGQVKAGFEINGKISRKEFDLKWNTVTEAGGVVVGDEVKLHLGVQLVKQA
ncbi:MAG: polyisoprenoid-binding protein [Sphingobacteriales bacterium]|nr:MAG: polyisoprenoid-binding protein [Sphingobacteriales bacterium]